MKFSNIKYFSSFMERFKKRKPLPKNNQPEIIKMKIGNSVKVKKGVKSPDDEDLIIEDWQGRITEIYENHNTILFELDSLTLASLTEKYITDSLDEGLSYSFMCLDANQLELSQPRDTKNDTSLEQKRLGFKYPESEEERRLLTILDSEDLDVDEDNQDTYFEYLKANISKPCQLFASEGFSWEESYMFGGGNKKEYEKLKSTRPSSSDTFEFMSLVEEIDEERGIFVKVRRLSDKKTFSLPLWDLKVENEKSPNYLLIADYSFWMSNYQ